MNERELSIPAGASPVLIFEQSAHCDWDWVATFPTYYASGGGGHQAVRQTLLDALNDIDASTVLPYTYVFCEVAWLRAFMNDPNVDRLAKEAMRNYAGNRFLFSSGGITSADNLAVHTEAFIRNYLLGRKWLRDELQVEASLQMWIPDDFGHDAQLPVLLKAMGYTGAGFERIPAQAQAMYATCSYSEPTSNAPSAFLLNTGIDFIWQAADGSTVQAHWLMNGYCEGYNGFGGSPPLIADGQTDIQNMIAENVNVPHGTYLFVPIDCDFQEPFSNLADVIAQWNEARWGKNPQSGLPYPQSYVVQGSFDQFIKLRAADQSLAMPVILSNPSSSTDNAFLPHPYYSGCYGSRPELKNLHYQTVRTLLMAESMELFLEAIGTNDAALLRKEIAEAWHAVLPSTHHDYITGTSPDNVYGTEQIDLLNDAATAATKVMDDVLGGVAAALPHAPFDATFAVFNSLGFERAGVVFLDTIEGTFPNSASADGEIWLPVQSADGGVLVEAVAPPMGYVTMVLDARNPNVPTPLKITPQTDGSVVMQNAHIYAVITESGIRTLAPAASPEKNAFADDQYGNQLVFYKDSGNIYRFAMEMPCYNQNGNFLPDASMALGSLTIDATETGRLCRGTVVVTGKVGGNGAQYTITYQLYSTDHALRISVNGAAPRGYSVMTRFPFVGTAQQLTYGTTSHWDTRAPRDFTTWKGNANMQFMTFEPAHEFVGVLDGGNELLGAIYPSATPGWAIEPQGAAVLGCILRNTPGGGNAAYGTDADAHTITFAVAPPENLRVPGGDAWGRGALLAEALQINNPLAAAYVPMTSSGTLSTRGSLASTTDKRVLVTAMKMSDVNPAQAVVRLTQQTNGAVDGVHVAVDSQLAARLQHDGTLKAQSATAMETPLAANEVTATTADSFTVDLPFALSTVTLGG